MTADGSPISTSRPWYRPSWLSREVWGWAMFDFANQAFTIVILTAVFQVYFVNQIVPAAPLDQALADGADGHSYGRQVWATCGMITQLIILVLSPLVGALADFAGVKKRLLIASYAGSVLFTALLFFAYPGAIWYGSILFVIAYLFYGFGENILSAFLPELAGQRDMGRVSGFSWTIAYFGAMISMIVATVITHKVDGDLGYRLVPVWAAVFFLVAGIPSILWLRERRYEGKLPPGATIWTIGFVRLGETARELKRYRQLFRFLAIMTFYFAGLQIIYWFGGTLAKTLFGFTDPEANTFIIVLTLAGIAGAAGTGPLQDRIGTRITIIGFLFMWTLTMLGAYGASISDDPMRRVLGWIVGVFVGFGIGAIGTASRAMVGLFSPRQKAAEFFGFYGLAHKLSAMIGLGWITLAEKLFAGDMRLVAASTSGFFGIGLLLMLTVDERGGRLSAINSSRAIAARMRRERAFDPGAASTPVSSSPWPPDATVVPIVQTSAGPISIATAPLPASVVEAAPSNVYLDNNATTRTDPRVVAATREVLESLWANPSSVHRAGQAVRQRVELAREQVARLIGCANRDVVFTSGGTEAANLAIVGSLHAQPKRRLVVTSRLEHSAVRELGETLQERGIEVAWIDAPAGELDLQALENLLRARGGEVAVVSIMWANNETGAIHPVQRIGALCREHGVRFHTDATQWVGKMPTVVADMPIDLLSFAGHKFHGPKGVGALYLRRGVRVEREIVGGPQERDLRGGTENVSGIVGMGVAADLAADWLRGSGPAKAAVLRDGFERALCDAVPDAVLNGANGPRLWNTTNIGFPRLEAEAILLLLSERGVYASAGAACSSGSLDPSPVLLAMGVAPEVAHGSIRFSLSRETTAAELERAVEVVPAVVRRLRGLGTGD